MKTAIVIGFAGLAAAQSISSLVASIPSCAQAALVNALASTSCSTTDYACQCEPANKAKIEAAASGPIESACSPADISQVLTITTEICNIALASGSSSAAAPASSAPASSAAAASSAAPSSAAAAPASSAPAPMITSAAPASQVSDGQPQVTSPGVAVSQISDGQPQVTTPGPAYTGAAAKSGPVAGAVLLAAAAFAL